MEKDLREILNGYCACDNPNCGKGAICNYCSLKTDVEKFLALLSVPVGWPKKVTPDYCEKHRICMPSICPMCAAFFTHNKTREDCLLAHNSIIAEKDKEISQLREQIQDLKFREMD